MTTKSQRKFMTMNGFGRDRNRKDTPKWKKDMLKRLKNKQQRHRENLLNRLKINRESNKISPKTLKINSNITIDSFKKKLINDELSDYIRNIKLNELKNDTEFKSMKLVNELNAYLEINCGLNKLRNMENKYFDDILKRIELYEDNKTNDLLMDLNDTIMLKQNIYCPCIICKQSSLNVKIINVNNKNTKIYYCNKCNSKFKPKNMILQENNESNNDHNKRMLQHLNKQLSLFLDCHNNKYKCEDEYMMFKIDNKSGYLGGFCGLCGLKGIII